MEERLQMATRLAFHCPENVINSVGLFLNGSSCDGEKVPLSRYMITLSKFSTDRRAASSMA
jgi:hypothetical protein